MQSKEIHRDLGEAFLYVTFDIIEERFIEVKIFGACARGSFRIFHCAFFIAYLSLHIGDDIHGLNSSKSEIRNPKPGARPKGGSPQDKSEIGIAETMKT